MYDIPFISQENDINSQKRPFPWVPSTIAPKEDSEYLVALKGHTRPLIGWYHKNHWYYLIGYEFKDDRIEETFDDFDGKLELTHWTDFPVMPEPTRSTE